ncbi:MAG: hypothetical protein RL141_735 [Candidatus Parcubacteria bacterium]|jgi:hypothetical protein
MKPTKGLHNLETLILEELKTGAKKVSRMIEAIQKLRPGTTKQGVYAMLRTLRSEEKIVAHGGFASLNNIWLQKMVTYFTIAQKNYTSSDTRDNGFLNLADGEQVQYFFRDPIQTDTFWSHAYGILLSTMPPRKPVYLYNPHEWFLLAHRENERAVMNTVVASGRGFYLVAGNKTPLDVSLAKEFDGVQMRYAMADAPLFLKQNYYVNILGDYLIEAYLDPRTAEWIDAFFHSRTELTPEAQAEIEQIVRSRGRSRLVISRSAKKAKKLVALLERSFQ